MKRAALLACLLLLTLVAALAMSHDQARVRVVHASPSPTPSVDVIADDVLTLFAGVEFGEITDYLGVDANVYNIKVVETLTTAPAVIEADLSLFYGTDYTVVATGEFPTLMGNVLVDNNSHVPPEMTRVRLFHGSPDTDPVTVRAVDGPFWFETPVGFQTASPYIMVPAGIYDLEVTVAGTTTSLTIPAAEFPGGAVVTLFAIGRLDDGSLEVVPSVDALFEDLGDDESSDDDEDEDSDVPSWMERFRRLHN